MTSENNHSHEQEHSRVSSSSSNHSYSYVSAITPRNYLLANSLFLIRIEICPPPELPFPLKELQQAPSQHKLARIITIAKAVTVAKTRNQKN